MEKEQKKKNRFITGVYPCNYSWLLHPDTRWSEDGTYGTEMMMPVAVAKALFTEVQEIAMADSEAVRKSDEKLKGWGIAWPIKDYDGDEEQYRGMKVVAFKQKANPKYDFSVDVFDAANNAISPDSKLKIGNGTKLRVSFYIRAVRDNINSKIRILFHPRAAQIIDLVEWKADYGFEATEGFTAAPAKRDISDFRPPANDPADPFADDNPANQGLGIPEDDIPFVPNKA